MKTILKKKRILLEISNAFESENRKRNIILVVTIAFSIMSLFLLLSTVNGRIKADNIKRVRENGNLATAILENVSEEQYQDLTELSYVKEIGIIRNFGVWYQNTKRVATCSMLSAKNFQKMFLPAYDNVEGSYPENSNEIMVSVRMLKNLGIEEPEIGMEIPVQIVLYDWIKRGTEDVNMTFRLSGYYTDYIEDVEKLPKVFFSGKFAEQQNLSAFIDDALIKSDKLWMNSGQIEQQFYSDIILENDQNLLVINEGASQTIRSMIGNCIFALIGILLILLSMNLFIYNIVSISVSKDKREYGLLKVIGAEPKQMREIFIFSELKIILSGCVLGILFGSLAVKFILPQLLEKMYLVGNGNINHADLYSGKLLIAAVILCGIGDGFAFEGCIRTVMKLSPIECSKYEEKVSIPQKRKKASKGTGIAGIAWRNFTRNRKKMLITTGTLFAGIEVFLLAVLISNGLDQTHRICQEPDFEVGVTKEAVEYYLRLNEGNNLEDLKGHQLVSEEMISEIIKKIGINNNNIKKCVGGFGTFSYKSEAIKPRIDSWQYDSEIITELTVQVVSDEWIDDLEKYVRKKGYNTDIIALKEKNGFILLHNHELSTQQSEEADVMIGQKLAGILFEERGNAFALICCGYLDFSENGFPQLNMPWDGKNLNYIIISEKTMAALDMKPVIYNISFDVEEADEQEIKNIIQDILRDANQNSEFTNTYYLTASSDMLMKEQNYILAIRIIMGGFSGILMFFAFVSYYNTLLTGYTVRNKELAIMRSIGMTVKQLRKMLIYEGAFYCIFAAGFILTLGSGILLITGIVIHNQVSYFTFKYPVRCLFIALISMLLISIILPLFLYSSDGRERIRNDSK